jgi:outer membrane protein assembly factor BamE (lipoprotein component of BamABCDE complex)
MKRSVFVLFTIVAFALSAAASLGAAPQMSPVADPSQNWVGKTANDLLLQMGVPSYTIPNDNGGQTIDYVTHQYMGRGNQIDLVRQFNVDQNGKIISESVSQS